MFGLSNQLAWSKWSLLCLCATATTAAVHTATVAAVQTVTLTTTQSVQSALVPAVHTTAARQREYSFNPQSLYGTNRDVDLRLYNMEHYIPAGSYYVSLRVNQNPIGDMSVQFKSLDPSQSAVLCLDAKLLSQLDLKPQLLHKLAAQSCSNIKDLDPAAAYEFNLQQLKLDLSIPFIDLLQQPEGYIAPERFDQGINSAFVAYNANLYNSERYRSQYLSLNAGLNLGAWYFRHHGYFKSNSTGDLGHYQSGLNTLYRDIDRLKSRLSLGEFYTQAGTGDSIAILGVQLASDDNMLPWSMRSYAPVIQGVVNQNALVRVFQNGQQIYEKSIAAGRFELQDLTTLSSGDLRVEIMEYAAATRVLHLPMQINLDLIKKGRFKYTAALGRFKLGNHISDHDIGQASLSYGLSNQITLSSGIAYADVYRNNLLSATINTVIGGFKLTADHSQARGYTQQLEGQSYQLKYLYFWQPQRLNIGFNASRQSRSYQIARHALSLQQHHQLSKNQYQNLWRYQQLKNQYAFTLSKSFQDSSWGAIQANILRHQYWSTGRDHTQYVLNYSNRWRRVNYSIGLSRSTDDWREQQNRQDLSYYASISMPLDWKNHNFYLNSHLQHSQHQSRPQSQLHNAMSNSDTQINTTITGTLGADNHLNFGLGVNGSSSQNPNTQNSRTHHHAYNANMSYLHPYMHVAATGYHDHEGSQYSFSARGAWVAHAYGVTATNTVPQTFSIVRIDQGKNINLSTASGMRIDHFGHAIYHNNSPYSKNVIQIDPLNMPLSMTLKSNQATVIPRQYSSTLVSFNVQHSSLYILRVLTKYGVLPMGAEIRNAEQHLLGHLGQSNQAILDQFDPKRDRQLSLHWGNTQQQCLMQLPQLLENKKQSFQIIQVECY